MFQKEYTFETNHTRKRRMVKNILLVTFMFSIMFLSFCYYLPKHVTSSNLLATEIFYQKSPDLIAVFTGAAKRIEKGLDFAKKYPESRFLISGVYTKNSYLNILKGQDLYDQSEQAEKDLSHQVEIDYKSRNTLENVISTMHFLREQNQSKDILIVSSDYHIFRIEMLLNKVKREDDDFNFYFYGTKTDYTKMHNIKVLLKETVKVVRSFIFLLFWDNSSF
jgi:uncharacterized SAM-binding protein YcdF (DUF218 family)